MKELEARWAGTDNFVHVDYVANLDEAKTSAIEFQLGHHVRAVIAWSPGEEPTWFGTNKFVTFRLSEP